MRTYPTPHIEKLRATLVSDKLPANDKLQVEKAIKNYEQWIVDMDTVMSSDEPSNQKLRKMVICLINIEYVWILTLFLTARMIGYIDKKDRLNSITVLSKN